MRLKSSSAWAYSIPNTASASVFPYTCAMPQSSRTMVTRCASRCQRAVSPRCANGPSPRTMSAVTACMRTPFSGWGSIFGFAPTWTQPFTPSESPMPGLLMRSRCCFATLVASILLAAGAAAPAPRRVDWRDKVRAFAEADLPHHAWGAGHARRGHEPTRALARAEGVSLDDDALFAAAYLHDVGGIPPYAVAGVDHGDRSIELVDSVLRDAGFPMDKASLTKQIIDHHQYYRPPDTLAAAVLFRDADILDFRGAIDVARILSVTTRERCAPDLPHAVDVIRRHLLEMPGRLQTNAAKGEGRRRVLEMQQFLDQLSAETDSLRSL